MNRGINVSRKQRLSLFSIVARKVRCWSLIRLHLVSRISNALDRTKVAAQFVTLSKLCIPAFMCAGTFTTHGARTG